MLWILSRAELRDEVLTASAGVVVTVVLVELAEGVAIEQRAPLR